MPVLLIAAAAGGACGKKGPPLAPLVKLPAPPDEVAVRRVGSAVDVQLRVPAANTDSTRPADIRRVEVLAFTGNAPASADLVKHGTLVAALPVRKPPGEEERKEKKPARRGEREKPKKTAPSDVVLAPRPPASMENGFDQGDVVSFAEPVGDAQRTPNAVTPPRRAPVQAADAWQPLLQPRGNPGDTRYYYAVGVNRNGRRGTFSAGQPVPLRQPPDAPGAPLLTYEEKTLTVWWAPPAGATRPVQEPAEEGMLESTSRALQAATTAYNLYEVPAGYGLLASTVSAQPALGALRKPANEKPLAATSFSAPIGELGKERCFVVSTVVESRGETIESLPSAPACATLADTFPPAAPKGVAAVASEGAISLIWDANAEPDLAGYLVLRREAAAGQATQLTPQPIKETTFRDTTAAKGVRYTYTVIAVDTAGNRSASSEGVEETAR